MENYTKVLKLLIELDERHDDLLLRLEELDKQVDAALVLWLSERGGPKKAAKGRLDGIRGIQ